LMLASITARGGTMIKIFVKANELIIRNKNPQQTVAADAKQRRG
jgi:hypothetical protein